MSELSPNNNSSPPLTMPLPPKMEDLHTETALEISYNSEASTGEKRKREGKVRSIVWDHFTKILKEDGTSDKCQCNHCHKLFTCSSRSGTTHLLRHVTDGICPTFRRDPNNLLALPAPSHMRGKSDQKNGYVTWKPDHGQTSMDVEVEVLPEGIANLDYGSPSLFPTRGKLPQYSAAKAQPRGDAWMNEFKSCVAKLVQLTNGRIAVGSPQSSNSPDYSVSNALKCLSEMEDIPQSSEMYLDAVEILQDASERECFICLPPEPRRRWLQRTLHRRHPLRYSSNCD